jgi:hypothetical protein
MRILPLFIEGPYCPRCGSRTERVRTRFYLRPIRWILPEVRRRNCMNGICFWRGFSFPEKVQAHDAGTVAAAR